MSSLARADPGSWDLVAAVCLERPALITPQLTGMQKRLADLNAQVEVERSLLSDHEIKHR